MATLLAPSRPGTRPMATARPKIQTYDIESRWTPVLASSGWTPVVDGFLDHYESLGISSGEAMFLIHLIRHKWTEEAPYPSYVQIAKRMGVTPTAARGYARRLEQGGLLIRRDRPQRKTRAFDLRPLFNRLEKKVEEERNERKLRIEQAFNGFPKEG